MRKDFWRLPAETIFNFQYIVYKEGYFAQKPLFSAVIFLSKFVVVAIFKIDFTFCNDYAII